LGKRPVRSGQKRLPSGHAQTRPGPALGEEPALAAAHSLTPLKHTFGPNSYRFSIQKRYKLDLRLFRQALRVQDDDAVAVELDQAVVGHAAQGAAHHLAHRAQPRGQGQQQAAFAWPDSAGAQAGAGRLRRVCTNNIATITSQATMRIVMARILSDATTSL